MNVFTQEFLDAVTNVAKETSPISRPDIAKRLGLDPEYAGIIGSAIKLGLLPNLSTRRGVGGGVSYKP